MHYFLYLFVLCASAIEAHAVFLYATRRFSCHVFMFNYLMILLFITYAIGGGTQPDVGGIGGIPGATGGGVGANNA